jgi:hypothetical protein
MEVKTMRIIILVSKGRVGRAVKVHGASVAAKSSSPHLTIASEWWGELSFADDKRHGVLALDPPYLAASRLRWLLHRTQS